MIVLSEPATELQPARAAEDAEQSALAPTEDSATAELLGALGLEPDATEEEVDALLQELEQRNPSAPYLPNRAERRLAKARRPGKRRGSKGRAKRQLQPELTRDQVLFQAQLGRLLAAEAELQHIAGPDSMSEGEAVLQSDTAVPSPTNENDSPTGGHASGSASWPVGHPNHPDTVASSVREDEELRGSFRDVQIYAVSADAEDRWTDSDEHAQLEDSTYDGATSDPGSDED